ncbi:DoxX family protein [Vibrio vulnificus]|nr:DoxX family protein [Vibrio vulnificus]
MREWLNRYDTTVTHLQSWTVPGVLLFCRLWVAWVFFNAGLSKIASWDSTLYLFEFEYQVPILPWEFAAYLATAAELSLPLLLALGVFTRITSLVLFAFNAMAVISYPLLWEKGFYDHQLWGLMLLMTFLWGAGRISLDHCFRQEIEKR